MSKKSIKILLILIVLCFFVYKFFDIANTSFSLKKYNMFLNRFLSKEDDKFARDYIELLRERDIDTAASLFNPLYKPADMQLKLSEWADFYNKNEIISMEPTGYYSTSRVDGNNKVTRTSVWYQMQFKEKWAQISVITETESVSGKRTVIGLHYYPISNSLVEINKFNLYNKSLLHYTYFVLAIIMPLFILYLLLICVEIDIKRKWLWFITILICVGKANLNWTTGKVFFQILNFYISFPPCAGITQVSPYAPVIITISLPLGAMIFLAKLYKDKKKKKKEIIKSNIENPSKI